FYNNETDVIRSVVSIGDIVPLQSDAGQKIRRTVVIEDFESNQLDCTFWDHWVNMWEEYAFKRDKLGHVVFILQLGKKSHCIVYAKINRIHKENRWEYTACKECNKKVNVVERKATSSAVKSKVTFYYEDHGMDKAKITRKPSKTCKHGHGKRKSTKEAGKSSQS
ncbi:replication protein A 70 kDa DNA-binding subunit B, partial [Tanacetum coccineum]